MTLRISWLFGIALFLLGCSTPFAPHTLTLVSQAQAEAWTRPLSDTPLRQTFILPYDQSVDEIEVVLAVPDNAPALPSRPLTWQILNATNTVLREGTVETAGYLHNTPVTITFDRIPAGESIDLVFTAPAEAQLSLWRTLVDRYPQGTLVDSPPVYDSDLLFTLRTTETPDLVGAALLRESQEWRRPALWLLLVIVPLGWLTLWLFGNGEGRLRAPAAVGLSLALIPLIYIWFALINLHFYLPFVQSLLTLATALTFFIMVRRWQWLHNAIRRVPIGSAVVVGVVILLSVVTWLLAGRDYLAPPGVTTLDSGLLAQEITINGVTILPTPPLPPAALTGILSTISQESAGTLLIFVGLVLAVAVVPALFALTEEITDSPALAVWVLPLAWLWQGVWDAFAAGNWFALYSYALMPVTLAIGLRAIRATDKWRRAMFLAAIPLATLFLVQGLYVFWAWMLVVLLGVVMTVISNAPTTSDTSVLPFGKRLLAAIGQVLPRALGILAFAVILLAPTLTQRLPVIFPDAQSLMGLGYGYIVVAIALAFVLRGARRWLTPALIPAYGVVLLVVLMLSWWRSAPLPPTDLALLPDEKNLMTWMLGSNTPKDTRTLINVDTSTRATPPQDGMFWSPIINQRATVYTSPITNNTTLVQRALVPGALQDAMIRNELRSAGVNYVMIGLGKGSITFNDLSNKGWARLAYQSGGAYLFELLPDAAAE